MNLLWPLKVTGVRCVTNLGVMNFLPGDVIKDGNVCLPFAPEWIFNYYDCTAFRSDMNIGFQHVRKRRTNLFQMSRVHCLSDRPLVFFIITNQNQVSFGQCSVVLVFQVSRWMYFCFVIGQQNFVIMLHCHPVRNQIYVDGLQFSLGFLSHTEVTCDQRACPWRINPTGHLFNFSWIVRQEAH